MLTLIPSECKCGAVLRTRPGYQHVQCDSCSRFHFATSIEESPDAIKPLGRETAFHCLRCSVPLEVGRLDNTEVCFCPTCRGFVIDSNSLGALIQFRRASWTGPDDPPVRVDVNELKLKASCPACEQQMEAHHYYGPGNIILDTCNVCELAWLDHGELSKIVRAFGKR